MEASAAAHANTVPGEATNGTGQADCLHACMHAQVVHTVRHVIENRLDGVNFDWEAPAAPGACLGWFWVCDGIRR